MKKYIELKNELTELKHSIRLWKSRRKEGSREGHALWRIESTLDSLRYEARHKHIAYCLLRGTSYSAIENKTITSPNMAYVRRIQDEQEALRVSA